MPPTDILIALAVMLVISAIVAYLGAKLGRRLPPRASLLLAIFAAGVLVAYAIWYLDDIVLARIFPLANVIVYGNPQGPAMGLLAGLAAVRMPGSPRRRAVLVVPLLIVGLWRVISPVTGAPPPIGPNRWTNDVCRQSSKSSCSAASAATVLRSIGIDANEREMIRECLTHAEGTATLGLFRGLKVKTRGTAWEVVPFSGDADSLAHAPLLAVISIGLPGLPREWLGGANHSVVIFGVDASGTFDVGDPFAGRQRWTRDQLRAAYAGEGIGVGRR
jgi:hypothetical protein